MRSMPFAHHLQRLLLALLVLPLAFAAQAQAPQPPEVAAKSFLVVDVTTRQTLAERDADAQVDPASLTKLMTAYVVFAALKEKKLTLEQTLPVSKRAWGERKGGGSLMFIDTTMTPTVDELLRGLIVQSGNDAAVALAEGVAGSVELFVDMMNRQGQAFGLKNTSFKNVAGLTQPGHRSSARDIATVATRIITDFPEYFPYYSIKEYKYNNITQPNRNLLLRRDPSVDGMKTGYTEAAGYCLLATAQREFPNLGAAGGAGKRRLLTVVLNTTSMEARANESQKLLNWGFQAFDTVRLFDDGKAGRHDAGLEGGRQRGPSRPGLGRLRQRTEGRRRQVADQGRADRSARRPSRQGPARRLDQGSDAGRHARGRRAAGGDGGRRAGRHLRPRLGCHPPLGQVATIPTRAEAPCTRPFQTRSATSTASTTRSTRRRFRCSTAASSSATASTRWFPSTAGRSSASTSTWRGCRATSPSCASRTRTLARSGSSAAAS
jgi:D-alanyl-D-alanine carboxypeptidase (penicillin-binding protein 5/6)